MPYSRVLPPLVTTRTASTTRSFRGSIARPPTSLSTLRRRPYEISPRKTRFRLVANLCRAGFSPAGSHLKGFRFVSYFAYITSPFPRLGLAHGPWNLVLNPLWNLFLVLAELRLLQLSLLRTAETFTKLELERG
jgi:hypothetical protein